MIDGRVEMLAGSDVPYRLLVYLPVLDRCTAGSSSPDPVSTKEGRVEHESDHTGDSEGQVLPEAGS